MKIGKQTLEFEKRPKILNTASVVGPKEAEGPLSIYFDKKFDDAFFDEKTFEKAESKMVMTAVDTLLSKIPTDNSTIDYIFAGDLLNQCIATGYAVRELEIPFFRVIWCLLYICRVYDFSFFFCKC